MKKAKKKPASRKTADKKPKALVKRRKIFAIKKIKRSRTYVKLSAVKKLKTKRKKTFASAVNKGQKSAKPHPAYPAESLFRAKIKVIGIGGGGGSIVSEIGRSLNKAAFVVCDTDSRAFRKKRSIKYFLFGQELTHGLGTGLNVELARFAAESEKEKISKLFIGQDIIIFIASLGGGLGSGATKVFADACKDFSGISFGIFTLPFKFEGRNKYRIAVKALRGLRESLNVSITIPNEKIFEVISADTPITDAFSMVNKNLIESLESLIDLIYSPGIINIDFADLRTILKDKGNLAFLNTAEAGGKGRSEKIIESILNNPLYQHDDFTAEKVLFNIAGGGELSMFEVDKISQAISKKSPMAKIIFGISNVTKYKNKIKTTLLMTGRPLESQAEAVQKKEKEKKLSPAPESVKEKPAAKAKPAAPKPVKKKSRAGQAKAKKAPGIVHAPHAGGVPYLPAPAFSQSMPVAGSQISKLMVTESESQKKAIRRTALEIKKEQELEENKQSSQEKEWEIPAFLRFKK